MHIIIPIITKQGMIIEAASKPASGPVTAPAENSNPTVVYTNSVHEVELSILQAFSY